MSTVYCGCITLHLTTNGWNYINFLHYLLQQFIHVLEKELKKVSNSDLSFKRQDKTYAQKHMLYINMC